MPSDLTPAQAWRTLMEGNHRFVDNESEHPNQDASRRAETAQDQSPFATVFGCMDSRVAAEIIFDRGIGDLAVVRTAGHVVDSAVLGSLEFGAVVLGIPLVVVLGHDSCGAVKAALAAQRSGVMPRGYVRDIVERMAPSMMTGRQEGHAIDELDAGALMEEHVRHTVHLIAERSAPIGEAIEKGTCGIVGLGYQLAEGRTKVLAALGDLDIDSGSGVGEAVPASGR